LLGDTVATPVRQWRGLTETATERSPWQVIPADDKQNARLMISSIICDVLKRLQMTFTKADPAWIKELASMRRQLGK
jgi:Polyphosphate kinase 2 (PPK2)